jgi:1-acyl-sn-glycerol-3-phosphate acyltransferase
MLAREAGAEVLPVVTTGTGTVFEGGKLNLRNTFTVNILPPMEPDMEKVREMMVQASNEIN